MPSFSNTLEQAIHGALALANARKHELATLEHLLLSLIDEPDAARVMQACSVSLDELRKDLEDSMSNLTKREKKVLSLRFGLAGYPVLSLQKIGKQIGLSKERIRQIEKKAIRKIRTGKYSHQLVSYLT